MQKLTRAANRVVLYSKDICLITGRKYRTARKLYLEILASLNKRKDQFITLEEFCSYTRIRPEQVQHILNY